MKVLVVGATGATGRWLVRQLLSRGCEVKAVVRSSARLPDDIREHAGLTVISAGIAELGAQDLARHVKGCHAVASCLGHNLSFRGLFGQPRMLVSDATRRLCEAVASHGPGKPVRFVLMNSVGVVNRDLPERVSTVQACVVGLLRVVLPPQLDNERAADYLRIRVGQDDNGIEWVVVRPESLVNEIEVTRYRAAASPIRSAIFTTGKISRINVAHFMAELITDDAVWARWKGKMPVVYRP